MKLYVNWHSSLKSIKKNKKRSMLTMFGIVIGIAAVIAILSIGRGFERKTIKSLSSNDSEDLEVMLYFEPDDQSLYEANVDFFSERDVHALEAISGIKRVEYPENESDTVYGEILIRDKKKNKQFDLIDDSDKEVLVGRNITSQDNATKSKVVMIDSQTANELYESASNAIGRSLEYQSQSFLIIGVYEGSQQASMFSMPESNIQIPKETYYYYFPEQKDHSVVNIVIENGLPAGKITTKAIDTLKENGSVKDLGEYKVYDMAALSDEVGQILTTITYFISAVAGISLFIAGVGVMNMMYISVSERTKEIGIRRALGATRNAIRLQFLLEGLTLTLIGGLVGYLLGMIIAYGIGGAMDIPISIDLFTVTLAIGVSSGIGLIFSVMPASEAAKKDLIDILR